ncbi:hypothetical protein ACLOJK_002521 [Asimina triloba]
MLTWFLMETLHEITYHERRTTKLTHYKEIQYKPQRSPESKKSRSSMRSRGAVRLSHNPKKKKQEPTLHKRLTQQKDRFQSFIERSKEKDPSLKVMKTYEENLKRLYTQDVLHKISHVQKRKYSTQGLDEEIRTQNQDPEDLSVKSGRNSFFHQDPFRTPDVNPDYVSGAFRRAFGTPEEHNDSTSSRWLFR